MGTTPWVIDQMYYHNCLFTRRIFVRSMPKVIREEKTVIEGAAQVRRGDALCYQL